MTSQLLTSHVSTLICFLYISATHLSNNQARVQAGPQVVDKARSASQPVTVHPGHWVRHRDGPDGAAEYDALSARPGGFKFTRWRESASHRHGDTGSQVPISLRRRAGPCRGRTGLHSVRGRFKFTGGGCLRPGTQCAAGRAAEGSLNFYFWNLRIEIVSRAFKFATMPTPWYAKLACCT